MIELPCRKFLLGLTGVFAAPAIVRASSIMKIAPLRDVEPFSAPIVYADKWRSEVASDALEAMNQKIAQVMIYGNVAFNSTEFTGLARVYRAGDVAQPLRTGESRFVIAQSPIP